ncbi:hypothetical protein LC605_23080 [Nostoc sp. CHAB 5836]|nr:hypothetical protein [Nostoc sp. CHAB 5836]
MVRLTPTGPPGRASRKALVYHGEIVRLRALGYTLSAIRQALADAGIEVSLATISRELRHVGVSGAAMAGPYAGDHPEAVAVSSTWPSPALSPTTRPAITPAPREPTSGRDLADAFMKTVITNPLFRSRSHR